MADLDCCFLTFNCGRKEINSAYFAQCLYDALSKHEAPPDIVVFSLQEMAQLGYAFLGGSFITPNFKRFEAALEDATNKFSPNAIRYENLLATNAGMTGIMLFAQPEIATNITKVETAGVGVGNYDLGNKGAVGVRIGYSQGGEQTEMTFVAAHLAPAEDACERRNKDWKDIVQNLVFSPAAKSGRKVNAPLTSETEPLLSSATDASTGKTSSNNGLYRPTSHFFLAGDLNYRASDLRPHPEDHKSWAHPSQDSQSGNGTAAFSNLFENDQLVRELRAKRTLHNLSEAPITFSPTYKYSDKAQAVAGTLAAKSTDQNPLSPLHSTPKIADGEHWVWASHRVPSWCDRILYLNPPFQGTQPKIGNYTSLPLQPTSDHQPVVLTFSIPLKAIPASPNGGEDWIKAPFPISQDWRERRRMARNKELLVGVVAYLSMTTEGRMVLAATVAGALGGYAMIKSLVT